MPEENELDNAILLLGSVIEYENPDVKKAWEIVSNRLKEVADIEKIADSTKEAARQFFGQGSPEHNVARDFCNIFSRAKRKVDNNLCSEVITKT
jgi:hypothetical protein